MDNNVTVRPIDATSASEVELVAKRMRLTLQEVLGQARGQEMYTIEWLIKRVQQHLNGELDGAVFVSQDSDGNISGHTIVRLEKDENGNPFGLFSTIYVDPPSRRRAIASQLINYGEGWMRDKELTKFATYTSSKNYKLIRLFETRGYQIVAQVEEKDMVVIEKVLAS